MQAIEDIDAIAEYIARDAPRTAKRFADKLYRSVEPLKTFPETGHVVPELGRDDIREIGLKRYRIIYRVLDLDTVEVLTVYHGSRLLDVSLLSLD